MERAAINAPIQGAAADIIRRAMIRMQGALDAAKLSAKMLLQVHDELIFETRDEEIEATMKVVKRVMEKAPEPAVKLTVPLQVDAREDQLAQASATDQKRDRRGADIHRHCGAHTREDDEQCVGQFHPLENLVAAHAHSTCRIHHVRRNGTNPLVGVAYDRQQGRDPEADDRR